MHTKPQYALHPYQQDLVEWMKRTASANNPSANGGIIGAHMGLGKTFTTLEYLKDEINAKYVNEDLWQNTFQEQGIIDIIRKDYLDNEDYSVHLIICSKTLINEWINQIDKFYAIKPKYFVLHNDFNKVKDVTVDDLKQYDIVFTTYSMITGAASRTSMTEQYIYKTTEGFIQYYEIHPNPNRVPRRLKKVTGKSALFGIKWDTVICDECQVASNWKTSCFKSIYSLCKNNIFGLSGTPIKNNQKEFIALLKLLGVEGYVEPRNWGRVKTFPNRFFELFKNVTYEDAGITLPDTNRHNITLDMEVNTGILYSKYFELLEKLLNAMEETHGLSDDFSAILAVFTKLRQICLSPSLVNDRNKDNEIQMGKNRLLEENELFDIIPQQFESEKLEAMIPLLQNIKQRGEKVLIFSSYTKYLELIEKEFKKHNLGTMFLQSKFSINNRERAIEHWKQSEDDFILMMNYRLGAEGLNLVEANNVILLDTWWNSSLEEQAIARVRRIGQHRITNVYRYIMRKTIEELIYEKSQSKIGIFQKLKNHEEINIKTITRANLAGLITEMRELLGF
jgi:SNF2 family DNA or RNA helicase